MVWTVAMQMTSEPTDLLLFSQSISRGNHFKINMFSLDAILVRRATSRTPGSSFQHLLLNNTSLGSTFIYST